MSEQSVFGLDYSDPAVLLARSQERNAINLIIRLREERERQGLTQAEVARRMGRDQSVVSRIERVGADPRWSSLRRYATALGMELDYEVPDVAADRIDSAIASAMPGAPASTTSLDFSEAFRSIR